MTIFARLVEPAATYTATVVRVVDGDTFHADVTLGTLTIAGLTLDVVMRDMPVRLAGCNAWELSTDAGKAARANLTLLLIPGTRVTLSGVTEYKYGMEVVAAVALPDGQDLVTLLVATGWLARWSGAGVRPVPPWPRTVLPLDAT